MPKIDLTSPLTYLFSLLTIFGIFGIMSILNKLLEDKIVGWIKSFYKKIRTHDDINNAKMQEIMTNINSDLAVIRSEFRADRACIFEFHNGSEFTSKFPAWKVTNTYERVRPGIPYGKEKFANVPATLLWEHFLELLFKDNPDSPQLELPEGIYKHSNNLRCAKNTKSGDVCPFPRKVLKFVPADMPFSNFKTLLENQGIEVAFYTPIIGVNGKIIGLISVEYNDVDDFLEQEEHIHPCALCNFASQIALLWEMESKNIKHI